MLHSHRSSTYNLKSRKACGYTFSSCEMLGYIIFSLLVSVTHSAGSVPQVEIFGLHSLYLSASGDFWRWRSPLTWDFTQDGSGTYLQNPCYMDPYASPWEGLSCAGEDPSQDCSNQTCHVTGLQFFFFGLLGELSSGLSMTSHLQSLVIIGNGPGLVGEIPSSFGDLTELREIDLGFNMLTSTIPDSFSRLAQLSVLTLWENDLSGHLPSSIGELTELVEMDVESNQLSGPLPASIGQLKKLQQLWCTNNAISGSIPAEIGGAEELVFLGLHGNKIGGPLPPDMGNLSKLEYLDIGENFLTGSLPMEVSGLVSLGELWLTENKITGCIPPLGALVLLDTLSLSSNKLRCELPLDTANLTSLVYMHVNDNLLSGKIPEQYSRLVHVSSLGLYQNKLTGSIPSSVGLMSSLNYLGLFDNLLSGTIPSSLGLLTDLIYLGMGTNQLWGSIPVEICDMENLETLEYPHNHLTGSLPACMGISNVKMDSISLHDNQLSGLIPPTFGNLSLLQTLALGTNSISGVIPPEVGSMNSLVIIDLSSNVLSGSLPAEFSLLGSLEKVNMAGNLLSGEMINVFNSSLQVGIAVLDFSDNKLSGALPDNIFQLPQIETIALSVNCFGGSLPSSMCAAQSIEVFSMDGLGAAQGCKDSFTIPVSGVALFNSLQGSIPSCIWSFSGVRILHFSGNGLGGTLEPLANETVLEHLALAHNQISGTIPHSLRSVHYLDLSYNSISGDFRRVDFVYNDSEIDLSINRLSGQISEKMQLVEDLNMLEGNLFSCSANIPKNDKYYNDFICGSRTLDGALYGMFFLCTTCAFLLLCYNIFRRDVFSSLGPRLAKIHFRAARQKFFSQHLKRMEALFSDQYKDLSPIILFGRKLHALWVFVFKIAILMFLFGAPIFVVKRYEEMSGDFYYSTHTSTYRWFWTFAYISGQMPAVLILIAWMTVITLFFVYFRWIFPLKEKFNDEKSLHYAIRQKMSRPQREEKEATSLPTQTKLKLCLSIVLNVLTIVIINAVYIYSSDQDLNANTHLVIQFGFAVFNVMYGLVVLPLFASPLQDEMANINFRLWLLKFNNLFVPCIVTFLSSSSCMQGLLVESDPIISHYTHEVCDFWFYADISTGGGRTCGQYSLQDVDVVPLVPPYIYNYQCGSVFLTLYIPVYIYMYSFQLLIPFIYVGLLSLLEYETIPSPIRPMVPAIIWPKYLLKQHRLLNSQAMNEEETEDMSVGLSSRERLIAEHDKFFSKLEENPSMLFNAKTIITFDILHNLSILFTFGLCSPFLTVIISTAMILKINMWLVLMGRFLNFFNFEDTGTSNIKLAGEDKDCNAKISQHKEQIEVSQEKVHPALVALSIVCFPLEDVFRKSVWPITWTSAAFFAFLCWDLSADKVGWEAAIWIPCCALSFPIFMWIVTKVVEHWGSEVGSLFVMPRRSSTDCDVEMTDVKSESV